MSMALFKLKLARMFVNSKRLAKHVKKNELEAIKIFEDLSKIPALLEGAIKLGYNNIIVVLVEEYVLLLKKYYKLAVFGTEEDVLEYLRRDEQDFDAVLDTLKEDGELLYKVLPSDESNKKQLYDAIQNAQRTEQEIINSLIKDFQLIRDQKHDRKHFRENLFTFDEKHSIQHVLRDMRDKAKTENHLDDKEEDLAKELEKELKRYDGKDPSKLHQKAETLIADLSKQLAQSQKLLLDVFRDDALFVIRYAVHHFFEASNLEAKMETILESNEAKEKILSKENKDIQHFLEDLDSWRISKQKETFLIIKKFKRLAKHDGAN